MNYYISDISESQLITVSEDRRLSEDEIKILVRGLDWLIDEKDFENSRELIATLELRNKLAILV